MAAPTIFKQSDVGAPSLNGTAGSMISVLDFCLVTGLGWTKVYSGTNKAAYQAPSGGPQHLLRVDDTAGTSCNVRGYETMSDVDTGTNPFVAAGTTYTKSSTADGTARPWLLIGDDRTFYMFRGQTVTTSATIYGASGTLSPVLSFGEFLSNSATDSYNTCMMNSIETFDTAFNSAGTQGYAPRASDGFSATPRHLHPYGNGTFLGGQAVAGNQNNGLVTFPNPVDGGLHLARVGLVDRGPTSGAATNGGALRGFARGLHHAAHSQASFSNLDTFDGVGDYADKAFVIIRFGGGSTGGGTGYVVIETTEWEHN